MKDKAIFFVIAATLIGLATWWFFSTYEKREVDTRTEPSPEVRADAFFGFNQYLASHDIETERVFGLNTRTQLPELSDTLIFMNAGDNMTNTEQNDVMGWVASGGHLVLGTPYFSGYGLFERLGLAVYLEEEAEEDEADQVEDEEQNEPVEVESQSDDEADDEVLVFMTRIDDTRIGVLEVSYLYIREAIANRAVNWTMTAASLNHPEEPAKQLATGFDYGLGSVTVLGNITQIRNAEFYKGDNAFISMKAMTRNRAPGKIWYISSVTRPKLWEIIWDRAAHVVLWGALGVLFFFWWAGQRFGRILPDPPEERREFQEHISASGRFLWRNEHRVALLNNARKALDQRIGERFPAFKTATDKERHTHMVSVLGKDADLWDTASRTPKELNKHQFSEQIKAIQELWKKI